MYYIQGITVKAMKELERELGYKAIKEDYVNNDADLHDIYINTDCIIKINDSNLTIDLGGVLYTVKNRDYVALIVH